MKEMWNEMPNAFAGFTWNLNGYSHKTSFSNADSLTMNEALNAFRLSPEPPVNDHNACVREAIQQRNLDWFSFFLHHYEPRLNGIVRRFFQQNGIAGNDPERFLDYKLNCAQALLLCLSKYDPDKDSDFLKFAHHHLRDALLFSRAMEEAGSFTSIAEYRRVRRIGAIYNQTHQNQAEAVAKFLETAEYKGSTSAEDLLTIAHRNRSIVPLFRTEQDEDGEETGEDVTRDDRWDYVEILWNGIRAEKIQEAFSKLNYREQTILERRLAICMTCGRVGSWKHRPTFEDLAIMFEGSTANGAERAYKKAIEHLTEALVANGTIHAIRLKQKSKTKHKRKITSAVYEYQADCEGEWGEFKFNFETNEAEVIRLAELDTTKTNRFAKKAIAYLQQCENPPKEMLLPFEDESESLQSPHRSLYTFRSPP